MTASDKKRFALAMHMFEITFNSEFDDGKLAGYFMALEDLRIDHIEAAVKDIAKKEKRTPPPAVIREYVYDLMKQQSSAATQIPRYSLADIKPQSECGKESMANIMALLTGTISKREFLTKAAIICDKYGMEDDWIASQWEELDGKA